MYQKRCTACFDVCVPFHLFSKSFTKKPHRLGKINCYTYFNTLHDHEKNKNKKKSKHFVVHEFFGTILAVFWDIGRKVKKKYEQTDTTKDTATMCKSNHFASLHFSIFPI